jgi:TPR repeat protein
MSIKKLLSLLSLIGLSVLFAGCSTNNYLPATSSAYGDNSPTSTGVRYLLGRGVPQDNKQAFYYFNQAAKQGDLFAENEIAYMYAAGKGTSRNYEKSFYWYKKAAGHGLSSAEYNLGLLYLHGLGTAPDKTQAIEWFKKSAAHGFEPARIALTRYTEQS